MNGAPMSPSSVKPHISLFINHWPCFTNTYNSFLSSSPEQAANLPLLEPTQKSTEAAIKQRVHLPLLISAVMLSGRMKLEVFAADRWKAGSARYQSRGNITCCASDRVYEKKKSLEAGK